MSFVVAADTYDRFMGRYSSLLAPLFLDFAAMEDASNVLDVGCGPGALTTELARRFGPDAVTAVDPSPPFAEAVRERLPGVTVEVASAEQLPFASGSFDGSLAQLVVHFMSDPVGGVAEMARVTRTGGTVAACVWDFAGFQSPISPLWRAAVALDATAVDESGLPGATEGDLVDILQAAGLASVDGEPITFDVEHQTFEEWWEPYLLGVGPAGEYVASLDEGARVRLAEACRAQLPPAPFTLSMRAWAARGTVVAASGHTM